MTKFLLSTTLATGLFFSAGSAVAQTAETVPASSATTPTLTTPTLAAADSTQAVQRLFKSRRTGSTILGFPGGYMLGYGLVSTARGVDGAPTTLAIGAVLSGISISKGARFNKVKEAEIIRAYQDGKPLPAYVRNRIKKKHLKGAAPVEATAQRPQQ